MRLICGSIKSGLVGFTPGGSPLPSSASCYRSINPNYFSFRNFFPRNRRQRHFLPFFPIVSRFVHCKLISDHLLACSLTVIHTRVHLFQSLENCYRNTEGSFDIKFLQLRILRDCATYSVYNKRFDRKSVILRNNEKK